MLVATLTNRIYLVLRALLLSGVFMVAHNPYILLFDPGFQLSFVATLGLILGVSRVENWLNFIPNPDWLQARSFLAATLVTQVFVLPLLLYQIGEVSLVAVFVNVLVLPMVAIAMLLTFLSGLLGLVFVPLATPFVMAANLTLNYIINIAVMFANLPLSTVKVPAFPLWFMFALYALLALLVWRVYRSARVEDELLDWQVVEESDLEIQKPRGHFYDRAAKEVPIFFR